MKIGNLDLGKGLALAPLAGISGLPFRLLARRWGADLVFTEMISAIALTQNPGRCEPYFRTSDEERPVAAQIFGSRPEEMARAAAYLSERPVDFIDINMGCPVRKVIRSGSGAALMRDLKRAEAIIRAVVRESALPVTVKMRSGWDGQSLCAVELGRAAEQAGAAALSVHPRTQAQGFGGASDWEVIGRVKEAVRIPVIGNGDIRTPEDSENMIGRTGCDGIMVGRAALGDPWIFQRIGAHLAGQRAVPKPSPEMIEQTLLEHLDREVEFSGERRGVLRMRKFAAWYSRGLPESAGFRARINGQSGYEGFRRTVTDYFCPLYGPGRIEHALA